jgi:hypothetical protein
MNEFEELSARQLDRFVDGELSDAERRDVLLSTDGEPDGWRRLALAFVESQLLRRELRDDVGSLFQVCRQSDCRCELDYCRPETDSRSHRVPARRGWLPLAALVTCSLVAFGLGRWTSLADAPVAHNRQSPAPSPRTFVDGNENENLIADVGSDSRQHQTLRLVFDDLLGGSPQAVEVPVVDESQGDPIELLRGPPVFSSEIQRALLRAGRRVHEQRQLYEVELSDGRRGVIPVSNVLVENAGLDLFQ